MTAMSQPTQQTKFHGAQATSSQAMRKNDCALRTKNQCSGQGLAKATSVRLFHSNTADTF